MTRPRIDAHYGRSGLLQAILDGLDASGSAAEQPTSEALGAVDHFHSRGREATIELMQRSGVRSGSIVLDVGGGIGGAARLLARDAGCRVVVLDLTEEYVRVGRELTRRVGLHGRVSFVHGDALSAPFEDEAFDVVWTQHSSMNVVDKPRLYRELRRLLKPGGLLAMHEILAGPNQPIRFPVPWARDGEASHLITSDRLAALLEAVGFRVLVWEDQFEESLAFFRRRLAAAAGAPPPLGLHLLLGPDYRAMFANQVTNLEARRIEIVMAVLERER